MRVLLTLCFSSSHFFPLSFVFHESSLFFENLLLSPDLLLKVSSFYCRMWISSFDHHLVLSSSYGWDRFLDVNVFLFLTVSLFPPSSFIPLFCHILYLFDALSSPIRSFLLLHMTSTLSILLFSSDAFRGKKREERIRRRRRGWMNKKIRSEQMNSDHDVNVCISCDRMGDRIKCMVINRSAPRMDITGNSIIMKIILNCRNSSPPFPKWCLKKRIHSFKSSFFIFSFFTVRYSL